MDVIELITPVAIFCITQIAIYLRIRSQIKSKEVSIAKAISGDLSAIKIYLDGHLSRIDRLSSKEKVEIRELKFLHLQSSVIDSGILSKIGDLHSKVANATIAFYTHLEQYNLILDIVTSDWEARPGKQTEEYQKRNVQQIATSLDELQKVIKIHYPKVC